MNPNVPNEDSKVESPASTKELKPEIKESEEEVKEKVNYI